MATYTEQINASFKKALDSGRTPAQAYETIKSALGSNASAIASLESAYTVLKNQTATAQKLGQKYDPVSGQFQGTNQQGQVDGQTPTGAQSLSGNTGRVQSWNLSGWNTTGSGTWAQQPVLTIDGQQFKFDTPKEYIDKLNSVKAGGGTGPIDQFIQEFSGSNITTEFQGKQSTTQAPAQTTPAQTTDSTYTVAGKQRTKAEVDAAYEKGTEAQKAEIQKQTGLYPVSGKLRTRDEVDAAYAKASPDQRSKLNQETGLSYDVNTGKPSMYSSEAEKAAYKDPAQVLADKQKENRPDVNVDYSQVDAAGQQFKTGYDAYIEAQKGVYNIATDRQNQQYGYQTEDLGTQNQRSQQDINTARDKGLQSYDWQGQDLGTQNQRSQQDINTNLQKGLQSFDWQAQDSQRQIQRNREDYARYTSQEVKDTARQLALNDTSFARSLTNASRAYGQRGILQAGIQKASLNEGAGQFSESQNYFKTLSQRRLESADTNMNQAEQDYATNSGRLETQKGQFQTASDLQKQRLGQDYSTQTGRLGTQRSQFQTASDLQGQRLGQDYTTNSNRLATTKSQYSQDRAAGSEAMVAGLRQQGNTLYGQNQLAAVQLAQQQAEQAALDKLYGRSPQSRPNLLKNIY